MTAEEILQEFVDAAGTYRERFYSRDGFHYSPVARAGRRAGGKAWRSKPVLCSNGERYPSIREAADATGAKKEHIYRVLHGNLRKTKGLTFQWI